MEKLYFENEDSNICMPLGDCLDNTDELKEVTLIEAIPEKESMYCFCTKECDVVPRSDCRKAECDLYEPNKSGRGACIHRGKLYGFGEKVTFNIESGKRIKNK